MNEVMDKNAKIKGTNISLYLLDGNFLGDSYHALSILTHSISKENSFIFLFPP